MAVENTTANQQPNPDAENLKHTPLQSPLVEEEKRILTHYLLI